MYEDKYTTFGASNEEREKSCQHHIPGLWQEVSRYHARGSPQGRLGTGDGLPQGREQGALLCLCVQARPAIPTACPWVKGTGMLLHYRPHRTHTRCGNKLPSHLPMRPGQKVTANTTLHSDPRVSSFLPRASGATSCDIGLPVNHCSSS